MKATYILNNLKLIERNQQWLQSGLPTRKKLGFYPFIGLSYLKMIVGKKSIHYLGEPFYYDNPATPLNLQPYAYEISKKILRNMDKLPKTVLDIGGNIGQFSRTLLFVLDNKIEVDVFEPNTVILPLLHQNMQAHKNVRIFDYGVSGEEVAQKLYFEPNRSATGSLIAKNAGEKVTGVDIKLTANPERLTGRKHYDLIKIDVEGFELEALAALSHISCRYLYIEVSGLGRKRSYTDAVLYKEIMDNLGEFEVLYASGSTTSSVTYELLLRFPQAKKEVKTGAK